jgi:tryptophan-rich sensory protein
MMRIPTLVKTGAGVGAAAAIGSIVTTPRSQWYQRLEKPAWQPPATTFPIVWTGLYALIALAGARALDRMAETDRRRFRRSFAGNLALNAAWTALFFGARRPGLALVEIAALDASNLQLLRRAWRSDRAAGAALVPYVVWTGFATGLNASIAVRNRRR